MFRSVSLTGGCSALSALVRTRLRREQSRQGFPQRLVALRCVALRLLPRRAVLERSPSLPPTGRTTFTNEAVDASSHEAVDALRTAVLFKLERTNPRLETRRGDQRIRDFYQPAIRSL
jgi:hypothetical protein